MSRRALLLFLTVTLLVAVLVTPALARVVVRTSGTTAWSPARVSVARGTRVVWRATGSFHNVSAYGGNWSFFRAIPSTTGDPTASKVFRRAGRFRFRCTIHSTLSIEGLCSGMCGRVRVTR